jgi:phenylpropionate dioxygenase-like ring-hydroxylating dioxygenase large terminal subunit
VTTQTHLSLKTDQAASEQIPIAAEASFTHSETFQWTQQWYPMAVAEFLDQKSPHALQLLGKELVLWCDKDGAWHCFEDRCPHRLAPLSEGRVEADGTLMCAYHAWRFGPEGQCLDIPQSLDLETAKRHRDNPRACAIAYPTQCQQGLIWVWPESGAKAEQLSQECSPRTIPELAEIPERTIKLFWYVRDFPYGWDFFMKFDGKTPSPCGWG